MRYSLLLQKLKKFGYGQIGRLQRDGYDMAWIAKPADVVYPFQMPLPPYPIVMDGQDPEIDEEIVDALLRWCGIEKSDFDGPPN